MEFQVEGPRYGGFCIVRGDVLHPADTFVRFTLPGERIEAIPVGNGDELKLLHVLQASQERVAPLCSHFGACGGCDYQHASPDEQMRLKRAILTELLEHVGIDDVPAIGSYASEPYSYRNRIRLRVERMHGGFRIGYNERASTTFLPIHECPIASPSLLGATGALVSAAAVDRDAEFWLSAASEVELFCNQEQSQVQVTLLCAPRTKCLPGSFARAFAAFQAHAPAGVAMVGMGAIASDERTGPTGRVLAEAGSAGLTYRVLEESYWITRGGFFQVNRFLVSTLVELVTSGRSGLLAWDLFAGVGLFSRVLARSFQQVVAVEANAAATADNRSALARQSATHTAVAATALDFLRGAVLQRERPDLVVLDPPRAGVGVQACELLAKLSPATIVYVSCDPKTLARDLHALQGHYRISAVHLVDLFPQTFHLETVTVLERIR